MYDQHLIQLSCRKGCTLRSPYRGMKYEGSAIAGRDAGTRQNSTLCPMELLLVGYVMLLLRTSVEK